MSIVEQKVDADSEHQILSRWGKPFLNALEDGLPKMEDGQLGSVA